MRLRPPVAPVELAYSRMPNKLVARERVRVPIPLVSLLHGLFHAEEHEGRRGKELRLGHAGRGTCMLAVVRRVSGLAVATGALSLQMGGSGKLRLPLSRSSGPEPPGLSLKLSGWCMLRAVSGRRRAGKEEWYYDTIRSTHKSRSNRLLKHLFLRL
eukprot:758936-Hanusia_phi.AAC.2